MTAPNPYDRPSFPLLIVISGPSGVGKDTIARELITRRPDQFYFVVTATTRPPRDGEVDGVDYFFVSEPEFARMIGDDELLEYAIVYNDYKGVPKQQIRDALASGRDVIMRVDVQGAATIRHLVSNGTFIFLSVESEMSLTRRLRARSSESDADLSLRIATARQEIKRVDEFNYYVVNPDARPDEAVEKILGIIAAEKCRVDQERVVL